MSDPDLGSDLKKIKDLSSFDPNPYVNLADTDPRIGILYFQNSRISDHMRIPRSGGLYRILDPTSDPMIRQSLPLI